MGLLDWLFGKTRNAGAQQNEDSLPPLYGGDGSSVEDAVVVNCASTGMANQLIDQFIAQRHGEKDRDWERVVEAFVNGDDLPVDTIRAIGIVTNDRKAMTYYFDIGRVIRAMDAMAKLAGTFRSEG
jgi:hypothetical protein